MFAWIMNKLGYERVAPLGLSCGPMWVREGSWDWYSQLRRL